MNQVEFPVRPTTGHGNVSRLAGIVCLGIAWLQLAMVASAAGDARRDATVEAVEKVMPAVVNIATETIVENELDDFFRQFFGYGRRGPDTEYSVGSGVIIDETGYVLTNDHVVKRANRIWVKLADRREPIEAEPIAGTSRSDVALLKLKAQPGERFTAVKFARDDDLLLGETVLALGNPFGLGGSVSRGILSSKNRRPPTPDEPLYVADWLQTDAAINPGNSGGALVNLRGELIGINVAMAREGQGIGFAIPIKQVAEALAEIFTPEVFKSLWFGAQLQPNSVPVTVRSVQSGSPADKAGLRTGDRILQVGDQVPRDYIHVTELLTAGERPDRPVVVQRGTDRRSLSVRLMPLEELIRQKLGVTVKELSRALSANLGLKPRSGLLVGGVDRGSPADQAGLGGGSVITSIEGVATPDLFSAANLLAAKPRGDSVRVGVIVPWERGRLAGYRSGTVMLKVR
jgi:S1-C subfamily serine protease